MPPAEERRAAPALASSPAVVHGWGGGDAAPVLLLRPRRVGELARALELVRGDSGEGAIARGAIARGMGRSYGDAAQLRGGIVLDTALLQGLELDPEAGTVVAQAGVTIGSLLARLVPAGWIVPVLPGTQHVTVGGAIASDIHGKNHGAAGTFGSHVEALGLLTAAGEVVELDPGDDLFQATLGGMGLTGVVVWARIRVRRVSSPLLSVDSDRVRDLDEALAALRAPGGPHRVAWLDLLGPGPGRGVVTRAEHLDASAAPARKDAPATIGARATVPKRWPAGVLCPAAVRAFNELRFRRAPRRSRGLVESIGRHMFPLDVLGAWPRLYGRHGFLQYQLVVPYGAEHVLRAVIELLRRARVPCYLAVLKDLGAANSAPLSFPLAGWTITLDLPRSATAAFAVLDECDRLVAEAGGRVYLTKDARLRPDAVRAMYPRLREWQEIRDRADPDGVWRSDLGLRTGIVSAAGR